VLSACADRTNRRTIDGRLPVATGSHLFDVSVSQISAAQSGSGLLPRPPAETPPHSMEADDLTILTSWSQAVAEAVAFVPQNTTTVLDDAQAGAAWRSALGVAEPSAELCASLEAMRVALQDTRQLSGTCTPVTLMGALQANAGSRTDGQMARRALQYALGSRQGHQLRERPGAAD
jgi:hypothetical protein